jgi:PAS domain S-box-containing protein
MRLREIVQIVDGTSDPAFAIDGLGNIVAWNRTAAEMFGISTTNALGKPCNVIIGGIDEEGVVCSNECIIQRSATRDRLIQNFDLRIRTPKGRRWFNISVIVVDGATTVRPYTIHLLRSVDIYKRLEILLRDFVIRKTNISQKTAVELVSSTRSLARETPLTKRETQILKLVSKSETSLTIANKLQISSTTVDNHLQHILKKLGAHSRLEAVLRAEHSGLL